MTALQLTSGAQGAQLGKVHGLASLELGLASVQSARWWGPGKPAREVSTRRPVRPGVQVRTSPVPDEPGQYSELSGREVVPGVARGSEPVHLLAVAGRGKGAGWAVAGQR